MKEHPQTSAGQTARAYHRSWTSKRFEEATALLAPELEVEVPVNAYPTRASFAEALARFAGAVDHVDLLAGFEDEGEAMLLYDMDVRGLGRLRVAEHFTVRNGRIVRLRQVHDTAPIRAAGLGGSP